MAGSPKTIPSKSCNCLSAQMEMLTSLSEEHQRRSPDCLFFSLSAFSKPAKSGRTKKGRTSKTSRVSTQSMSSNMADEPRLEQTELREESMVSVAESTATTAKTKTSKKGPKAKKEARISRMKKASSKQDNSQVMSSIIEPEDDNFEVKVRNADSTGRGKKRKSAEMTDSVETHSVDAPESESQRPELPAKKRRAPRSRTNSILEPNAGTQPFERSAIDESIDVTMNDAEDHSSLTKPSVKKTAKGRKQRASSRTRKPSAASAAAEASLRADVPSDEEIDAALEEDLDRPLTDYGSDNEAPPVQNPKGRRITKSKASSNTEASQTSARIATETSAATTENSIADIYPNLPAQVDSSASGILGTTVLQPAANKSKTKKQTGRKASAKEAPKGKDTKAIPQVPDVDETKAMQDSQETREHEVYDLDLSGLNHAHATNLASASAHHDPNTEDVEAEHKTKTKPSKKGTSITRKKDASTNETTQVGEMTGTDDATKAILPDDQTPEIENATKATQEPELYESEIVQEPEKAVNPSKTTKATAKAPRVKKINAKNQAAALPAPVDEVEAEEGEEETAAAEPAVSKPSIPAPAAPSSPATPHRTGGVTSVGASTPVNAASPQSSDAENHPPSSRPSQTRPPLSLLSPSKHNVPVPVPAAAASAVTAGTESPRIGGTRIPLATITPLASPSKSHQHQTLGASSRLHSTLPWSPADLEQIFQDIDIYNDNTDDNDGDEDDVGAEAARGAGRDKDGRPLPALPLLSSPERRLTVEEWIRWKAGRAEEKLRRQCESVVGRFEGEGVRALRSLEGIGCVD